MSFVAGIVLDLEITNMSKTWTYSISELKDRVSPKKEVLVLLLDVEGVVTLSRCFSEG